MKRTIAYILFFCLVASAAAQQDKQVRKAYQADEKGNQKGALKIINKVLEKPEHKNDPQLLMFKSELLYKLSQTGDKDPVNFKEALKFADKSISKDPEGKVKRSHEKYLADIIRLNNTEGKEAMDLGKYAKAIGVFKRSCNFGADTFATIMLGDCYWSTNDKLNAAETYTSAVYWIYNAYMDSVTVKNYCRSPFRNLSMYYLEKRQFDTAWMYMTMGKTIFPNDPVLKDIKYALMRISTQKMPPSYEYLDLVTDGLKEFPEDSFFNIKENSLYIFLLNNAVKNTEYGQADSLLRRFTLSKTNKSKLKSAGKLKTYDIFISPDANTVLLDFAKYLLSIGAKPPAKFVFNRWSEKAFGTTLNTPQAYLKAVEASKDWRSVNLSMTLFEFGLSDFPKDKTLINARKDYCKTKNLSILGYYDLEDLLKLNMAVSADFPKEAEFKNNMKRLWLKLVDMAADSGDFYMGYNYYREGVIKYPEEKATFKTLQRKLSEHDFIYNYVNSRVNLKGKKQPGVPEYEWNGSVLNCVPGNMSEEIKERVISRINYFRRQAGVMEEAVLTKNYNENCEWAALMCEANNSMSHEPGDAWQCYTPAGADALKLSILSKDANPSIAVTAAMGQNHKTMGFRRWMLYPKARYMGVGAAKNYTAIWTLDDGARIDTNKYKHQFVAWPNEGFVPDMLLFKKWTFSIDQSLKGAVVTMKHADGTDISLVQEELTDGYGMPTLVWEPKITLQQAGDTVVHVTVTLGNGKKYIYEVTVFKPKG